MIDLENLSTRSNAVILVIAGIKFDRNDTSKKPLSEFNSFYRRVDIKSCTDIGLHIDQKTLDWWNTQPAKVRNEAFNDNGRIPIKQALSEFSKWYGKSTHLWCNGANFDAPILDNAYIACGMSPPWMFWQVRDTRTIYELAGLTAKDLQNPNKHNALSDCHYQIYGVQESIRRLKTN